MHLILVSNRMATAKTLTITPGLAMLLALAFVALVLAASLLVASMGLRLPAAAPGHAVVAAAAAATAAPPAISSDPQDFVRGSLNAMAVKLGELQAQLLRLDSQGERLARLAGVAPESSGKHGRKNDGLGGEGGPLLLDLSASSETELRDALEEMQGRLEQRRDRLTALESQLIEQQIKNSLLPTLLPIDGGQIGSGFGKRRDPIARMRARHEGVDFVADSGTRVSASAGGVGQPGPTPRILARHGFRAPPRCIATHTRTKQALGTVPAGGLFRAKGRAGMKSVPPGHGSGHGTSGATRTAGSCLVAASRQIPMHETHRDAQLQSAADSVTARGPAH